MHVKMYLCNARIFLRHQISFVNIKFASSHSFVKHAIVAEVGAKCYRSEEMTVASLKLVISHKVAIFHHFANDQK